MSINSKEFDVIIIGAGIGGLICGCLLAKKGLKILLCEKSAQVGGYCTSFKIKGYEFDAFAHSLGNLSEGAQFHRVLTELEIYNTLTFKRYNPSDLLIFPDLEVPFYNDLDETVIKLSSIFPDQKEKIKYFFCELLNINSMQAVALFRGKTFEDLLLSIFSDKKLINILSLPVLGNLGVLPNKLNAFTAIKHYRQFLVDGGYYPTKGMQSLPNILAEKFKELGGQLLLSTKVERIINDGKTVSGVGLRQGIIGSKFVVSDCDCRHTFIDLVGVENLDSNFISKLKNFEPSYSLFVIYIAFHNSGLNKLKDGVTTWLVDDYSYIDKYSKINDKFQIPWLLLRADYSKKNCMILTHARFENEKYWNENKYLFQSLILEKIKKFDLNMYENINFNTCVSPYSLFRWTGNFMGAGYGWAATIHQFCDLDFMRDRVIKNLYLCGHWSTIAQGVDGVAIVGERVAKTIVLQK